MATDGIEHIKQQKSNKWNLRCAQFMHHISYLAQGIKLLLDCHTSEMDSLSNTASLLSKSPHH